MDRPRARERSPDRREGKGKGDGKGARERSPDRREGKGAGGPLMGKGAGGPMRQPPGRHWGRDGHDNREPGRWPPGAEPGGRADQVDRWKRDMFGAASTDAGDDARRKAFANFSWD